MPFQLHCNFGWTCHLHIWIWSLTSDLNSCPTTTQITPGRPKNETNTPKWASIDSLQAVANASSSHYYIAGPGSNPNPNPHNPDALKTIAMMPCTSMICDAALFERMNGLTERNHVGINTSSAVPYTTVCDIARGVGNLKGNIIGTSERHTMVPHHWMSQHQSPQWSSGYDFRLSSSKRQAAGDQGSIPCWGVLRNDSSYYKSSLPVLAHQHRSAFFFVFAFPHWLSFFTAALLTSTGAFSYRLVIKFLCVKRVL